MTSTTRRIILRRRDLNSRGNGVVYTRRLRLSDGRVGWASVLAVNVDGAWGYGTMYAEDRRAKQIGQVDVGTVVVEYARPYRGGTPNGASRITAGIVVSEEDGRRVRQERLGLDDGKSDVIDWGTLSVRGEGMDVEVLIDNEWVSI